MSLLLTYDFDGDIDEVELSVDESATVRSLRSRLFNEHIFQFPFGVDEEQLQLIEAHMRFTPTAGAAMAPDRVEFVANQHGRRRAFRGLE